MSKFNFSEFVKSIISDKKKLSLALLLLTGTVAVTTTAVVLSNPGSEASQSSNSGQSSTSSSSSSSSSQESEVINDFNFDDAEFVNVLPVGFESRRYVQGPNDQIMVVGFSRETQLYVPQFVVLDSDYTILHSYEVNVGAENGTTYLNNDIGNSTFMNGVTLENGDYLLYGQYRGHLLKNDNTRVQLGGLFASENIPVETAQLYFMVTVSSSTFNVDLVEVSYTTGNQSNFGGWIQDFTALGNDEFLISGTTSFQTGLFVNRPSNVNSNVGFVIKFGYTNSGLTLLDDLYFSNSSYTNLSRTLFHNDKIYVAGHTVGNEGTFSGLSSLASNSRFPFLIVIDEATFTVTHIAPVLDRIVTNVENNEAFIGNIVLGHDGKLVGTVYGRTNSTHSMPNSQVSSVLSFNLEDGTVANEYVISQSGDLVHTYYVGRTETGYFLLGNTEATSGSFLSSGQNDMLMVVLNKSFAITEIVIWGGGGSDYMQTWPLITSRGTLIVGVGTNSTDGTFAEFTEGLTNQAYVSFFIELK